MGNFVGPTLAGFLVESMGFREAILVFLVLFAFAVLLDLYELFVGFERKAKTEILEPL